MIRIAITAPQQDGCRFAAFDAAVVIGRGERSDLVLTARGVSSTHCRLSPLPALEGAYMVEDLGSTYGTYVNGARVVKPVVVSERDLITVGSALVAIVGAGGDADAAARLASAQAPPEPPSTSAPRPAESVLPATDLADFDANAPWPTQFARIDSLAHDWHEAGRPKSALLRGPSIGIAERWLQIGARQDPAPDALHQEFIVASRRQTSGRTWTIVLTIAAVLVLAGAAASWFAFEHQLREFWAVLLSGGEVDDPEASTDSDSTEGDVPEAVAAHDIAAITERSLTLPHGPTRLLLQAGIAESALAQNEPFLDGAGWKLNASAQKTLSELRETILSGHDGGVTSVAFGPVGRYIVSTSADASARVWDLGAPAPTVPVKLRGHLGQVNAAAISPDGRWVVTVGEDKTVRRWDLSAEDPGATGSVLRKHKWPVTHVAIHPAGRFAVTGDEYGLLVAWDLAADDPEATAVSVVAHEALITDLVFDHAAEDPALYSASDDRLARRWRVGEGFIRRAGKLSGHIGGVTSIAVSDDANFVATGGTDGEVYLWDRRPKSEGKIALLGHKESVNDLAFTPDGKLLVTASDDDTLRVWEVLRKDPSLASVSLSGHTGDITAVMIAAGGKKAVSAGLDNTVRVWDLVNKDRVVDQVPLKGHGGTIAGVDVSPDGLWIVSGSEDATVRVWDGLSRTGGRGGKILRLGAEQVLDVDATEVGDQIVAVGGAGQAAIWDLRDDARLARPRPLVGLSGLVNATAFDARGGRVATGGDNGEIQLWLAGEADPSAHRRALTGHEQSVNALAFTPAGDRLISVSSDQTVRVWAVDGSSDPLVWSNHGDEVHTLAVAVKGDFAVTAGLGRAAIRWDLSTGAATELGPHDGEVVDVEISPTGKYTATACVDLRARVFDSSTGKLLHVMRGHTEPLTAVAFSTRDKLATGGQDAKILVYDLASEHPHESPRVLTGHEKRIADLAFTPDGSVLVSASNDATLRMWKLDTGDSTVLRGHDNVVNKVKITGDGRFIASASYDGTVRLWPLDYDRLAWLACDVVGYPLAKDAWSQTFGPPEPPPICAPAQ